PDYAQALSWYQEALKLQPGLALRQKIEYRIARSHQELGQHNEALTAFNNWLQRYASDNTAKADRVPAAMEAEARYQYGRAQLAAGQPAEARKTWQDFLTSPAAKEAGGELVAEASYRLAGTYGIPTPGSIGDLELGVAALEKFLKAYPKHKLAAKAELEIAQSYAHHARYDQAIARLKAFLANEAYAKADEIAEARRLLGQSYFNQKRFPEAIAAWKEFLEKHPNNAQWSMVQQQVVDSEYQIAAEHARKKQYAEARAAWETFLNKYPLDPRAAGILFRFGQMKYAAAVEIRDKAAKAARGGVAGVDRREPPAGRAAAADVSKPDAKPAGGSQGLDPSHPLPEEAKTLFEEALADWQRLVSKYPNTNEASQAAHSIGITLEDQLGRLPEALEAYNKVTGQQQAAAKQRVANLTAKQLEVVTERKFRSNEKPEIVVHTRNVEAVQVKLYRVDMLDYFRKMHLATGVESLDVALIDPDRTVDHSVQGYEKYRRHENRIVLPLDGPGVTAVTVTGEKLEATTMIVVSDLDLIVKSSRNELFVYVQNMLTGKPADGVSLLVSDGAKVFSEATTNKDGVLQKPYEELKTIEDLRVFAAQDGHSASSVVGLNGLEFAVGLAAKGSLWTDRPVYRPGQLVNIKGVVRWVDNDRYTFKPGEKYQLDVYDPRGRVLHSAKATLGEFGTFAANLTLPDSVPQGDCRVHLHQPGKEQSYETTFGVRDFKLEPIHLTIDLKQKIFYRGEKVTGTIKLAYYYGAPLAGRTVQFRLADDRLFTETTNDKGEVPFSFDTARYSESQPLILSVQHPERNLTAQEIVYLATRGFVVSVSTQRPVFIAGETFDVTASVADPSSKPVETPLKLEVFEETRLHGERGERLVATHDLKSDDKGKARQTLKLETAGRYLLRTTGIDRFGNPVSGQTAVQISGDDDKVRLRILSGQHLYKVGDTAKVEIHWREAPALALVTSEGARILGYRLVALKTGSNTLDLPIDTTLAPNFELAVAVMEKNRFHQARSGFLVTRRLNIALKPSATTLKPGDELKVDVTATDPQGKPVSAEISLGLIQRNLLDVFADTQANLEEFFSGGVRTVSMRAATSCTFRYEPRTRGVSEALLAEADRVEVREMERKSREELKQEMAKNDALRENLGDDRPSRMNRRSRVVNAPQDGQFEATLSLIIDQSHSADADSDDVQSFALAPDDSTRRFGYVRGGSGPMDQFGAMVDGPGPGVINWSMFGRPGLTPNLYAEPNQRAVSGLKSHTIRNLANGSIPTSGSGAANSPFQSNGEVEFLALSRADFNDNFGVNSSGWGVDDKSRGTAWYDSSSGRVQLDQRKLQTDHGQRFLKELHDFDGTVLAVNGRGEFQVINGLTAAAVQQLAKDGLEILPGQASSETGYWNPVIVT
ncbi:MAG: tetratricopeptide repeat protein, partial [Planctomycetaceae bacterium]|nr:tetratricopeptide repeat protein [Planctomycetaceae bacterium]